MREILKLGFLLTLSLLVRAQDRGGPTVQRVVGMRYPRLAQFAQTQGRVELIAVVSKNGRVQDVKFGSGDPVLVQSAKDTLSRWLFSACEGASSTCEAKVIFNFVLLDGTCDSANCTSDFQFDLPNVVTVSSKHFVGPVE